MRYCLKFVHLTCKIPVTIAAVNIFLDALNPDCIGAYPESLKLGHSLILLGRLPKQAPDSVSSPRQLLPQPDDLTQAGLHKVWHAQQAQRVTCWGCVKDDPGEASIILAPDKLHNLHADNEKCFRRIILQTTIVSYNTCPQEGQHLRCGI